jgi:transcriptional regulator with XRE-family HTH domain
MKLKWLRKQQGISQKSLADMSGTTQQQIALIENGKTDPRISTLDKIADALGVGLKDLFFDKQEFTFVLNQIIVDQGLSENLSLKEFNFCITQYGIDPYEKYWELIFWDKKVKLIKLKENL